MSTATTGKSTLPRPSVIQFAIKDLPGLASAYMPFLTDGGLFIPTPRDYELGDSVYVLITLPDDPLRYPVAAKVAWVTPANAAGGRTQGVGIRLARDEKSMALKQKIEACLSNHVVTDRSSQTL
ncbi:MAG: PilZ domain-containing protein [Rhodoferax sp.]|jgi:type IV pilus assembly protein PilZ|uniref:PilZ domain-containing protein n=1 Tax=Rhodoferax sp. TaxID=50421 RepID=UPI001B5A4FA2|nr:PilZ domain-containing protein [Rhodoferax sp.]MBP9149677.1 PilZ domain-containing protein [Rhodoferax sp.]MBP9737541.1 PilZ domain-containing protein [Rhodoferax sp.]